jgi:hypothetical protein
MLLAMDSTPESALGLFSFDAAIVSLSSVWNAASSGCASVTVSGLQFGSHNGSASLALGTGTEYLCHTASWTSVSTTVCGHGQVGLTGTAPVLFSVGNLVSTAISMLSFDAPVLSLLRPHNIPYSTQRSATLAGLNFGTADTTATATLRNPDGLFCSTLAWTSMTVARCQLRRLVGFGPTAIPVLTLTIANFVSTQLGLFSYDSPALSHAHPRNLPATSFVSLEVHGLNFALSDRTPTLNFNLRSQIQFSAL